MKHIRKDSYVERGPIRFVGTSGFFFCFAAVTVAAFVAGFLRRGFVVLAYPMLAWSPFLLLIGLHAASRAIHESRNCGASTFPVATRAQCAVSIGLDLAIIVVYIPMFSRFGNANLAVNTIASLPLLIFVILDLASHVLSFARNPWSSKLRRAIPPVIWFCLGIYLAVGALWMLLFMRARG
jgi:hypothetical protein